MGKLKELISDSAGNIMKQLMSKGHPLTMIFGDLKIRYKNYDEFLAMWEDDTGIPCWTCGRELFRLRGTEQLMCFEGKVLGTV